MRLRRETEVAIAILVDCTRAKGGLVKTAEAAQAANTTSDFAAHVALKLVNAGLVEARRGRRGGLTLKRPADKLLLGHVIALMQPEFDDVVAFSDEDPVSRLAGIMEGTNRTMRIYLDQFSIADLADGDRQIRAEHMMSWKPLEREHLKASPSIAASI